MAVANVVDAIIARLLATSAVTALTSTRISGKRQDAWAMPVAAIVVDGPHGGPPGAAPSEVHVAERLDITCYGTTGKNAKDLAQTVLEALVPLPGTQAAFKAAHTKVSFSVPETGRIASVDPDTAWDLCILPLIAVYRREYAA